MKSQQLVAQQFGNMAENYLTSTVHAQGADLERVQQLAMLEQPARMLDLGCGAGHVSFALAASGGEVVAYDLSASMLEVVARTAAERQLANIRTFHGPVEALPFEDASFDLVVTRYSAHHWLDMTSAMKEMYRVLKPGGKCIVIDVIAPETPLLDTVLQTVEILRDASHVRDYRVSEWQTMLENTGFKVHDHDSWKLPLAFASWVKRIGTSEARIAALKAVFGDLPEEAKRYFQVAEDYSFVTDTAWLTASK
ncbi:class I SAM-dependent methyltransferase [Leeia oryzae]|uniref:class I SAM-dependent methyltransferase n=1 Tax=Leeia oryzae TaxID=356662 RepID=UPI0003706E24|nr:class I SAM-dependent methyltransferase [Leeia oryzae]